MTPHIPVHLDPTTFTEIDGIPESAVAGVNTALSQLRAGFNQVANARADILDDPTMTEDGRLVALDSLYQKQVASKVDGVFQQLESLKLAPDAVALTIAEHCFDAETFAKIKPIAEAEYLHFLNKEALEDGIINPVLLDRITAREVAAGRLNSDHDLRQLASAGAQVLGDSAEMTAHKCRQGDWLFYGVAGSAIAAFALAQIGVSPLWLIPVGLALSWWLNERERLRIKGEIAVRRAH